MSNETGWRGEPRERRERPEQREPWMERNTVELPESDTVELPRTPPRGLSPERPHDEHREAREPVRVRGGFWRGLTGALAGGLVALAVLVVVGQVIAWAHGEPGLGTEIMLGHLVAAVVAVLAQRQADYRGGRAALGAGLAVAVVVLFTLWLFWWL